MSFAHPALLLLTPAPLALWGMRYWLRRRYLGHPVGSVWSHPRVQSWPWRYLPDALMVLAMALLAVALADPRVQRPVETAEAEGRAVVMVLDLSFTMQERVGPAPAGKQDFMFFFGAGDPRPTRLDVLKRAMKDFVSLRRNDRIGLVVFSEHAYVISPLTDDYDYLNHYIDMIDVRTLAGEGYTAIGEGVAAATALLDFQGVAHGRQGVVLVFTDGENNFGRDPVMAVRQMRQAGHRGYFIGVDLPDYVVSRAAASRLAQAFAATGGRHYEAKSGAQLELAYRDVSALEPGSLRLRTRTEDWPVYRGLVIACLVLAGASLALQASPSFASLN
jgi:Ca-activated chloride channel family protein